MPSPVKNIHLLSLFAHLLVAKAQVTNYSASITGAPPNGSTPENLIVAAAIVAPAIVFIVIFMMATLCRRPFGNRFVLRTPALVLGMAPPFEDASSLRSGLHATSPDVVGDNV